MIIAPIRFTMCAYKNGHNLLKAEIKGEKKKREKKKKARYILL